MAKLRICQELLVRFDLKNSFSVILMVILMWPTVPKPSGALIDVNVMCHTQLSASVQKCLVWCLIKPKYLVAIFTIYQVRSPAKLIFANAREISQKYPKITLCVYI